MHDRIATVLRALPDEALCKHVMVPPSLLAGWIRKLPSSDLAVLSGIVPPLTKPDAETQAPPRAPKPTADEATIGRVFALICESDGAGKTDIAKALELDADVVTSALAALMSAGSVTKRGQGRATEYVKCVA